MASTMGRIYRATHRKVYGIVFIGLLVLAMYVIVALYNQWWVNQTVVHLQTPRVGNQLNLGGDVKMRGAFVGTVKAIHVTEEKVTVDLALKPKYAQNIPQDVEARILPKTIFGEKYIDLVVPDGSTVTAPIKAGKTIKIDDSKVAIETDKVFDDLLPLLQRLQPVKLNQALNAMATALQERGNSLGENFSVTDKYFTGLNPNIATINHDISGLADLAESYGNAAPDLLRLAKDSAVSLQEVVVPKQDQLQKFFTGTKDFANTTQPRPTGNQNQLIARA